MAYKINKSACFKCCTCVGSCPQEAIDMNFDIDSDKCVQCGICKDACPVNAISDDGE